MLDLDGFGKINDKFGYRKGDFVIKALAQKIYNSMRRDEEAYKRPYAGNAAPDDLWRRIYRKYSGGDEFIFLIRGAEDEALGFLLRLQRRFDSEFGKEVATILGEPWKLSFHAGVCRLNPGTSLRLCWDEWRTACGSRARTAVRLASFGNPARRAPISRRAALPLVPIRTRKSSLRYESVHKHRTRLLQSCSITPNRWWCRRG